MSNEASTTQALAANKALVSSFWQAFSESRFDDALALLADDATWSVKGKTHISKKYSKAEFAELVHGIADSTTAGITVTPTLMTAEDDRVSMEATSYGPLKNGRVYQNEYHFMHVVNGGKLAAVREYLDTEHVTEIFGP